MIKINLLSPNDKLSAKWEKINKIIIFSVAIIVATQLVFVLFIFASIKYLEVESDGLDAQLKNLEMRSEAKETKEIKNAINNYSEQLKCIDKIQKGQAYWTIVFETFSDIVPDEVKIKSLSIKEDKDDKQKEKEIETENESDNSEKYIMNIKGIAKKREYLLEFERNLKESKIFEPIILGDYMENNYEKEVDADFEYDLLIDRSNVLSLN